MARPWQFVELADLTGVAELDPERDAERWLRPTRDDPLLDGDADIEELHTADVHRWSTWLAS